MENDYTADELLDHYPFRPPDVAGCPRNWVPSDSKPEEYVYMFLGVLPQELIEEIDEYSRRKLSSACPACLSLQ